MRAAASRCAAAATMLAGCAGIPSSGPVERVADDSGPDQSTVRYAPVGPPGGVAAADRARVPRRDARLPGLHRHGGAVPDARRRQRVAIVRRRHGVLRTPGDAAGGDEGLDPERGLGRAAPGEVARLDRQGHYTRSTNDPERTYRLERIDGQWRVANPQSGVMVTRTYYDGYFRPFSLYFFDASGERLVPDLVHLAVGEQLPTGLVTALARGPGRTPGTLPHLRSGRRVAATFGHRRRRGGGRRGVLDVTHQAVRRGARPARRPDRVDAEVRARRCAGCASSAAPRSSRPGASGSTRPTPGAASARRPRTTTRTPSSTTSWWRSTAPRWSRSAGRGDATRPVPWRRR